MSNEPEDILAERLVAAIDATECNNHQLALGLMAMLDELARRDNYLVPHAIGAWLDHEEARTRKRAKDKRYETRRKPTSSKEPIN